MYKNGEAALERILVLVAKCPKELQETCFEALLSGYVQMELGTVKPHKEEETKVQSAKTEQHTLVAESQIPQAVVIRLKNTAKRIDVPAKKLESLFNFDVDPFTLHAVTLPGKKNADKARNVALVAAARSYFATGSWSADWQEVKSLSVDHSCYDVANHLANLKQGTGSLFRKVESQKPIELSSGGIKEAEKLLKNLSEAA
mgnify:CR=1 FL=1